MTDSTCSCSQPVNDRPISFILQENQITTSPPHNHPTIEVIVCLSGRIALFTNEETHTLEENNFVLISPHATHGYKAEIASDSLCMIFDENIYKELENANIFIASQEIYAVRQMTSDQIDLLNDCINHIAFYNATNDITLLNFYCKIFLTHLFRHILDNQQINTANSAPRINSILHYIQSHYREKVTLENLATNININRFTISKLINQHFGCTLPDLINQYRLFDACQLLTNTNYSILEISERVGYGSLNSFNRNFLRRFGITPNEFRKQKYSRSTFFTP